MHVKIAVALLLVISALAGCATDRSSSRSPSPPSERDAGHSH